MAIDSETTILTVLVESQDGDRLVGQKCLVVAGGRPVAGKVIEIASMREVLEAERGQFLSDAKCGLARLGIEILSSSTGEVISEGHGSQLLLLEPGSQRTLATGLAIPPSLPLRAGETLSTGGSSYPTIWFTGLSGAGKTTLAKSLGKELSSYFRVETLDADIVRTHICKGLGFSKEDRAENVRRLAHAARLLASGGAIVLVSAISPYRESRDVARKIVGNFIEVYVNAPLAVCESRDVKGLYKRARGGDLKAFTGIDDPYEPPMNPEVECRTAVRGSGAF